MIITKSVANTFYNSSTDDDGALQIFVLDYTVTVKTVVKFNWKRISLFFQVAP